MSEAEPRSRLFRTVWRWHFYAGLLTIPFIVILSLSGIVWLFKPQLDGLLYGQLRNVTPGASLAPYGEQLARVKAAVPGATITRLGPPPEPSRATEVGVTTKEGRDRTVYVDPYTARVLGQRDERRTLTSIALDMHGSLLTQRFMDAEGVWGDRLLELAASWAVVLVVTGLYLWWPRGRRRSLRAALTPRLRARAPRMRWRDVHAITGVLFGFITLFFLVTGLMWTGVWGETYKDVATRIGADRPPAAFEGVPSRKVADVVKGGKPAWAASDVAVPPSGGRPGHAGHNDHAGARTQRWDPRDGAPIDAIVARARRMGFPPGYSITFPADATSSYAVSLSPDLDPAPNQSALDERFAFIDQYTAKPVGDFRWDDFGAMAKVSDLGIAIHEGRQFGTINQVLTLVATLALLVSCATAVVMWRKRRPRGIGAPRRVPDRRLRAGVVALTLGLGALLPLLGISIAALLVLDFAVIRRIPPLARALGAN